MGDLSAVMVRLDGLATATRWLLPGVAGTLAVAGTVLLVVRPSSIAAGALLSGALLVLAVHLTVLGARAGGQARRVRHVQSALVAALAAAVALVLLRRAPAEALVLLALSGGWLVVLTALPRRRMPAAEQGEALKALDEQAIRAAWAQGGKLAAVDQIRRTAPGVDLQSIGRYLDGLNLDDR